MSSFIVVPIFPGDPKYNDPKIPYYYGHKQDTPVQHAGRTIKEPVQELKTVKLKHSQVEVTLDMKKKAVQNIMKKFCHSPKKLLKYAKQLKG